MSQTEHVNVKTPPMPYDNTQGCAYRTADCRDKGCKPAELCPAGHQVYRNWTGGGHHHE